MLEVGSWVVAVPGPSADHPRQKSHAAGAATAIQRFPAVPVSALGASGGRRSVGRLDALPDNVLPVFLTAEARLWPASVRGEATITAPFDRRPGRSSDHVVHRRVGGRKAVLPLPRQELVYPVAAESASRSCRRR